MFYLNITVLVVKRVSPSLKILDVVGSILVSRHEPLSPTNHVWELHLSLICIRDYERVWGRYDNKKTINFSLCCDVNCQRTLFKRKLGPFFELIKHDHFSVKLKQFTLIVVCPRAIYYKNCLTKRRPQFCFKKPHFLYQGKSFSIFL